MKRILVNPSNYVYLLSTLAASAEPIVLDCETTSLDAHDTKAKLVGLAVHDPATKVTYYCPVGHVGSTNLNLSVLAELENAIKNRPHIYHNAKFDLIWLRRYGWKAGAAHDTMIMAKVRLFRPAGLKELSAEAGYHQTTYEEALQGKGDLSQLPAVQVLEYAAQDVEQTWELYLRESKLLEGTPQSQIYRLEMKLLPSTIEMEENGILTSHSHLDNIEQQYEELIEQRLAQVQLAFKAYLNCPIGLLPPDHPKPEQRLHGSCPLAVGCNKNAPTCHFPLHSSAKLQSMLYKTMQLPTTGIKKTKTGYSTDSDSLQRLAANTQVTFINDILAYKEAIKGKGMIGTYREAISEKDGRIHPSLLQVHVIGGRYACAKPNMQNIPKSRRGQKVHVKGFRSAFIASPGYGLLDIDYQQIEMRIFAVLANATDLIKAILDGEDIHQRTASLTFNVPLKQVTKDQRDMAKTVGFGAIFGQTPHGLAMKMGLSIPDAERIHASFFNAIPQFKTFVAQTVAACNRDLGVRTKFGRWVPIPEIRSRNKYDREKAGRLAVNQTIQGTAADVMKFALVAIKKTKDDLWGDRVRLLLTVHDEALLEVPNDLDVKEVYETLKPKMEIPFGPLTLTTDAGYGPDFGALEDLYPAPEPEPETDVTIDVTRLSEHQLSQLRLAIPELTSDIGSISLSIINAKGKTISPTTLIPFSLKLLRELDPDAKAITFKAGLEWDALW